MTTTSTISPFPKSIMKEALRTHKEFFHVPKIGDSVEGKLLNKESGSIFIDLGAWGLGIIYGREYYLAQNMLKVMHAGDSITAKVVAVDNKDGYTELSLKEAGEERSWDTLKEKAQNGNLLEIKITGANRGGLMAQVDSMMAFLPVSQLSPAHYPRVEGGDKERILEELKKFVGETFRVRVIDFTPKEGKLIVSEKAAENDAIREALQKYHVGDVVEGAITGVVDFGAFMRFDPLLEGLIHISELDWQLIADPREVVKVGDALKAKVVDISADGRVSLSLKALKPDPWQGVETKFKKGDSIEGMVMRLHSYGALVKIDDLIQGLVHVSEFEDEEDMKKHLHEGDKKKFEILSIDIKEHRIALRLHGHAPKKEKKSEAKDEKAATDEKE